MGASKIRSFPSERHHSRANSTASRSSGERREKSRGALSSSSTMRDDKKSKLSWSKNLIKKWFSVKSKARHYHAGEDDMRGSGERRHIYSEMDSFAVKKSRTERLIRTNSARAPSTRTEQIENYRIFVSTWNVGGRSPTGHLNLDAWLHTAPPADVYVLGFQEIVPLNAGNVLGAEDSGPARKWIALIRKTLEGLPGGSGRPAPTAAGRWATSRRSFQANRRSTRMDDEAPARLERRFSVSDQMMGGRRWVFFDDGDDDDDYDHGGGGEDSPENLVYSPESYMIERERENGHPRYCLVASKQMVGIFLTIWVRSGIRENVKNLKVSCVGRGLMGYLGNKGSISISMSLHQTTFCFVCSHLTSGEKEGDELRRNSDVMEILKKTRFSRISGFSFKRSPETILDHDRIIWLGDLNYRIALSYRTAKALVEMHNWRTLLENDQLRMEQRMGRVFDGWNEGRIYFPPTYKYSTNSDRYSGDDIYNKGKRRTPAWCDRILWYGGGLNQISYVCGESRFSDHRPVYSVFIADVDVWEERLNPSFHPYAEFLPYGHGFTESFF